jgi:hypothetical protein
MLAADWRLIAKPRTRNALRYTSTTAPDLAHRHDVGNRWLLPRTQGSTIKTDRR